MDPAKPEPAKPERKFCSAMTAKGTRCSRWEQAGEFYCWQHIRSEVTTDMVDNTPWRCTATTKQGTQCKRAAENPKIGVCWQHKAIEIRDLKFKLDIFKEMTISKKNGGGLSLKTLQSNPSMYSSHTRLLTLGCPTVDGFIDAEDADDASSDSSVVEPKTISVMCVGLCKQYATADGDADYDVRAGLLTAACKMELIFDAAQNTLVSIVCSGCNKYKPRDGLLMSNINSKIISPPFYATPPIHQTLTLILKRSPSCAATTGPLPLSSS